MQVKGNTATLNRPEGDRLLDAPVLPLDIKKLTKQILSEKAWKKNDRNAITLFKTETVRLLLIAMHQNAKLYTARPENILIFQMLRGRIVLSVDDKKYRLNKGEILTVHEHIDYSVRCKKSAVFLLFVNNDRI